MRLRPLLIATACLVVAAPAASAATRREEAVTALREVEAVRDGRGVTRGFELTPALKELATRLPDLSARDRARAERMMTRPTVGQAQPGEDAYAIPEHTPYCTVHFCVHWVSTNVPGHQDAPPSADADLDGIPDYVETVATVFEHTYDVENGEMGWREPVGDGSRGGGSNQTDVYIKQLGDEGIFGYSTPDPNQKKNSQFAYLVIDNDFRQAEFPRYSDPLLPLQVTAAHEYNHVLQFGYDWLQDTWMFESTAVWAEDKVYDEVNDYVAYLNPWVQLTRVPLTAFDATDPSDPVNVKVYGDIVWSRWLEAHHGEDVIRRAWERSLETEPPSFAPGAFDASLQEEGSSFFEAFTSFAVDTAEWRSSAGPFEEGGTWPGVHRSSKKSLTPGASVAGTLDHTGFTLVNVTPTKRARIRFVGDLPRGVAGAVALVGREGSETAGSVEIELRRLPIGGRGRVSLRDPDRFSRITAVLINADVRQDGFKPELGDWDFRAVDGRKVSGLLTTDFVRPKVLGRTPHAGREQVSRTLEVVARFSEGVSGVSTRTVRLLDRDGRKVAARVSYDGRTRKARLIPKETLRRRHRYSVKITGGIQDKGRNSVPAGGRTWRFRTGD